MSVELTKKDISNPKAFAMKFLKGLVGGFGGIAQGGISAKLKEMLGANVNIPPEAIAAFEWGAAGFASAANKNEWIESALGGFSGASAMELATALMNRFKSKANPVPQMAANGNSVDNSSDVVSSYV